MEFQFLLLVKTLFETPWNVPHPTFWSSSMRRA
jgi:hypothetical protein